MGITHLINNVIIFCTYSLLISATKSEVIKVGGDNGWSDGFNYVAWAQELQFKVGDILVFSYTRQSHNVYDVTEAAFQTCDPSKGVKAMYNGGLDRIELKEAKQYWFICTVKPHCSLGQKFGINVTEVASNETLTAKPPIPQNLSNPNFSSVTKQFSYGVYFLLLLAVGFLYLL